MDPELAAGDRVTAFGNQLIEVHIWLRERLADLRDDVEAYLAGGELPLPDLRAHCLSFCSALTSHHVGEDDGAFPAIAEQFPELRTVIASLRSDHRHIDWILGNLDNLLNSLPEEPDPAVAARVRAELDGLTALMDNHFAYEEKKLTSVLNAMDVPRWRSQRPGFLRTGDQ